jgi:hypothetical protein
MSLQRLQERCKGRHPLIQRQAALALVHALPSSQDGDQILWNMLGNASTPPVVFGVLVKYVADSTVAKDAVDATLQRLLSLLPCPTLTLRSNQTALCKAMVAILAKGSRRRFALRTWSSDVVQHPLLVLVASRPDLWSDIVDELKAVDSLCRQLQVVVSHAFLCALNDSPRSILVTTWLDGDDIEAAVTDKHYETMLGYLNSVPFAPQNDSTAFRFVVERMARYTSDSVRLRWTWLVYVLGFSCDALHHGHADLIHFIRPNDLEVDAFASNVVPLVVAACAFIIHHHGCALDTLAMDILATLIKRLLDLSDAIPVASQRYIAVLMMPLLTTLMATDESTRELGLVVSELVKHVAARLKAVASHDVADNTVRFI